MSMSLLTLDQLRDLVPGYLFGTLDASERAAFEHGLRSPAFGALLHAELSDMRSASGAIAQAQSVAPPPSLRDRLQARIAVEASTAEARSAAQPPVPTLLPPVMEARVVRATPSSKAVRVTPPSMAPVPPSDDLARLRAGKQPSRAGWYASGILAAALAASVLFLLDLRTQVDALQGDARDSARLLARTTEKLKEKETTLSTLFAGRGNVVLVNLDATAPAGPGMQVFWNVRDGKAVVNAYGLAQVASNRAYMLWMIRDGKPVPLKLFTPDEAGRATVASVDVPTSTTGITLLAVTEEDATGATAPTMTPFIAGAVPAATR